MKIILQNFLPFPLFFSQVATICSIQYCSLPSSELALGQTDFKYPVLGHIHCDLAPCCKRAPSATLHVNFPFPLPDVPGSAADFHRPPKADHYVLCMELILSFLFLGMILIFKLCLESCVNYTCFALSCTNECARCQPAQNHSLCSSLLQSSCTLG